MKIIACDDDQNTLAIMEKWSKEYFNDESVPFISYDNGIELLSLIKDTSVSESLIILMDIQLKNDNGIDIIRELHQYKHNIAVIFISGYTEFIEDSFEVDPIYFLVKPLKRDVFIKAIEKAVNKMTHFHKKSICISQGKEMYRIFLDEIYYAESIVRKVKLYCNHSTLEFYMKMNDLEEKLKEDHFIRCHKSFIVNMQYIRFVDGNNIILLNGQKIPISRNRRAETKEMVFQYLGGTL
ncbi:MAG: LytTR family DNA-binding domain-containing protein [Lachnospiraceae bacterium]|nr:LytTR family DNA-binding domain-containing protein [Lachnospiraceae bacterium]